MASLFFRSKLPVLGLIPRLLPPLYRPVPEVGLAAEAKNYPHALSGGMRQRLSIAQALITRPKVLLLDEPFGALDPGTRESMHELVLKLWKECGMTIFLVTHDIREGFKLGTRLLVFDKVRDDPHETERYGATITYDIAL